ncbi:MAG: GspE/PulE family protein [Aestuariivirgaceae bacterium]|nr:GspE/PulE family protein [Aestuariivirgaceae bacterium]
MGKPKGDFSAFLTKRLGAAAERLAPVLAEARRRGESAVRALERTALIDPGALSGAVAAWHQLPQVTEADWPASDGILSGFSLAFLRASLMLPLGHDAEGALVVAVADPADAASLQALQLAAGQTIRLRVASGKNIVRHLELLAGPQLLPQFTDVADGPDAADDASEMLSLDAPVIELLNRILADAVDSRATDIHFDAQRAACVVRLRVDGMLRETMTLPPVMGRGLLARIKILSGLNIAERRLPQDGNLRQRIRGGDYDLRIATLPALHGESAVLRLLSGSQSLPSLPGLGLGDDMENRLRRAMRSSNGMVIATGPTGSGKTTTLAAMVSELNDPARKIVTIEDPVEYQITGITQVQARPDIGITFSNALRSFMRSDPDIILVGEMRDSETARIGIQASLTGHLVLSTLHTNSAAAAVIRLMDMGVEPYLLAASLRCVIGQRLVRVLCPHCRKPVTGVPPFAPAILQQAGLKPGKPVKLHTAQGCEHCGGSGYFGRAALFEVMTFDEPVQELVRNRAAASQLHDEAVRSGMRSLAADGLLKALRGITSCEEVMRVAFDG